MAELIEVLNQWDHALMLRLNSWHTPFWDPIMIAISGKLIWAPLYLFIIVAIYRIYHKKAFVIIPSLLLSVGLADVIASQIFKPWIGRLRPCHEIDFSELLHIPSKCGGQFGYFSSHASTTFAIGFFVFLLFRKNHPWAGIIVLWSAMVSYSRIYLGVHFPLDVTSGAICGVLVAYLCYWLSNKLIGKFWTNSL